VVKAKGVGANHFFFKDTGTTENIGTNVIDQYVSYLRKKLDAAGAGLSIVTERGRGYRLDARNAADGRRSSEGTESAASNHDAASMP